MMAAPEQPLYPPSTIAAERLSSEQLLQHLLFQHIMRLDRLEKDYQDLPTTDLLRRCMREEQFLLSTVSFVKTFSRQKGGNLDAMLEEIGDLDTPFMWSKWREWMNSIYEATLASLGSLGMLISDLALEHDFDSEFIDGLFAEAEMNPDIPATSMPLCAECWEELSATPHKCEVV